MSDRLRIQGPLLSDATLTYTASTPNVAVLEFEVGSEKGQPYRVKHVLGTDPTVHMTAEAKKPLLRRGRWVAVYASGAIPQSDHGTAALRLLDVTAVHPLPTPQPANQADLLEN
jgi:hypothetical protein